MNSVRQFIKCPYCDLMAFPLKGQLAKPIKDTDTRYGCENAHYFVVPTESVRIKDKLKPE